MNIINNQNISFRLAGSFFFNIIKSGVSFLTVILLARLIGPQDYGSMVFLTATFIAFQKLLDMSSTSAFFTFLSQRKRSTKFISFYWIWIGIQFSVSLIFICLFLSDDLIDAIWQGESRALIVLAFVATFMQQNVWTIVSQMVEAKRQSVRIQKMNALFSILHLIIIAGLWFLEYLILPIIFISVIFEWGIASILASRIYYEVEDKNQIDFDNDTFYSVLNEFWKYCWPFLPFVFLSCIQDLSSAWMLQEWGGSKQQAYYGIGLQFAAVALIFTSSLLRIFWKEIAEAQHMQKHETVASLYFKATRGLFFVSAIFVGAISPWAKEIISIFLGKDYLSATIPLMLMLIYPAHQSLGQLGSAMLLATENVKAQVTLGAIFSTFGTIFAFIILSPYFGLQLAATGLAIKMVTFQFIQVNAKAFVIAKIFRWKFDWLFQIVSLGLCLSLGWLLKIAVLFIFNEYIYLAFIISSVTYLFLVILAAYIFPSMTGFTIFELKQEFRNIRNIIRQIK
ncbi:lipopolysaccharide biosynthesis protein [Gammaproteobacteria bacterium]|nr:lipopolysaccharide biosynthesis protein [Gammaproteobacteria bacterium]